LAGGARSKLPPPSWPKFNDSYRSFFTFKDELEAFIKDYGQGTLDRTLAQQIKVNCLSKSSAAYVEWANSPAAILETLGGLFGRPSRLVESLLEPVRKQKRIQMDDYTSLLAYFTTVRNVLQEVRRLNQMPLFNTVAKKGDQSKLKNWRSISLLSNMYKIISRAINTRLQRVNNWICSRAQKGFNNKRYVQEVLINVCESINHCQKNNINGSVLAIDMAKAFDTLDHDFINEVYKFFGFGPNKIRWLNLCGSSRTACIMLDNSTYFRTFKLGCGRPQGDNTSPCTFNFCVQILIFKLELSQDILRIPRQSANLVPVHDPFSYESNRETDANESLADDNTLLSILEKNSLTVVKNSLNDFYMISGLKCNYDKTMIMPMLDISGAEKTMIEDLGFKVTTEISLLGATIYRDLTRIPENVGKIKDKIVSQISYWERFKLSLPGRISTAKTYLISQINYLGCIFDFQDDDIAGLQLLMNNFIRKNLRISDNRIYLSVSEGGLGFFNLKEFLAAQKCTWILRAKKFTIDNWRYDIVTNSPNNDPLLIRACDFLKPDFPVLSGFAKAFEEFYSALSMDPMYLGDNMINEAFFGRAFFNAHADQIRALKMSDFFVGDSFKPLMDFADMGLAIYAATWFRLQNLIIPVYRRYRIQIAPTDQSNIATFVGKFKKGSKKIRNFFDRIRGNAAPVYSSRSLDTFKTLTTVSPSIAKLLGTWMGTWNLSFLSNDIKVFMFNFRHNTLPLNNRLNSYIDTVDPRCTFCRIKDADTTQRDSLSHCFLHCCVTKKLLLSICDRIGIDISNENFPQLYWYGILIDDPNKTSCLMSTIIFDIFRYLLFKHRQRRHIPNFDTFFGEYIFIMKVILKCSKSFRDSISGSNPLTRFLQAIG
jgi:Reverse transcriptase (RNA-dependent DNA polymerase)